MVQKKYLEGAEVFHSQAKRPNNNELDQTTEIMPQPHVITHSPT